jgi:protein SMG7
MPPINNWVSDQEAFLSTGLNNFTIAENGILEQRNNFSISENGNLDQRLQGFGTNANNIPFPSHIPRPPAGFSNNNNLIIPNGYMHQMPFSSQIPMSGITSNNNINMLTLSDMSAGLNIMPSVLDFGIPAEGLSTRFMDKLSVPSKKNPNPVSRPVRHVGPPPGFNAPMKRLDETPNYQNTHPSHTDEYGYLNPYQPVQNHGTSSQMGYNNYMNFSTGAGTSMEMFGTSFGYPNTTVPISVTQAPQAVKDFQLFESSKPNNSNNNGQQENLQNSLWSGHYFV